MNEMIELIHHMNELRDEVDKKKSELDELEEKYNHLNSYLTDLFLCNEIQNIKLKEGTFYLNIQYFASPKNTREEVITFLKGNAEWLIKEDYNANQFNSYIRGLIKNDDMIPNCIKLFTKLQIRRRTTK